MCLRKVRPEEVGGPVVTSPEDTLKTVWRRRVVDGLLTSSGFGGGTVDECGGGGGTEKRALSCASVSRIRDVISVLERRALVNMPGVSNLSTNGISKAYY